MTSSRVTGSRVGSSPATLPSGNAIWHTPVRRSRAWWIRGSMAAGYRACAPTSQLASRPSKGRHDAATSGWKEAHAMHRELGTRLDLALALMDRSALSADPAVAAAVAAEARSLLQDMRARRTRAAARLADGRSDAHGHRSGGTHVDHRGAGRPQLTGSTAPSDSGHPHPTSVTSAADYHARAAGDAETVARHERQPGES